MRPHRLRLTAFGAGAITFVVMAGAERVLSAVTDGAGATTLGSSECEAKARSRVTRGAGATTGGASAGATSVREPQDQFYGDRSSWVIDPFGHSWYIHTHIRDVTPEEMRQAMQPA